MKASIKFRDEQSPLLRAKIPFNISNFPFQSTISAAGESKELGFSLSTYLDSGPSLKISYRPIDSENPLSFVFKTGLGHFGSPKNSPLTMIAEFNLIGTQNPSFFVHFKPNLGDFFVRKLYSSYGLLKRANRVVGGEGKEKGRSNNNGFVDVANVFSPVSANGLARGMELGAVTTVTAKDLALVNFRWGLKSQFTSETAGDRKADGFNGGWSFGRNNRYRLPYLVLNKIGIESVTTRKETEVVGPNWEVDDVAGARLDDKEHIEGD